MLGCNLFCVAYAYVCFFFVAEAQAVNANGFPAPEHEFGMVNPLAKVSIMIGKTSVT
jgi:hypothetical protein